MQQASNNGSANATLSANLISTLESYDIDVKGFVTDLLEHSYEDDGVDIKHINIDLVEDLVSVELSLASNVGKRISFSMSDFLEFVKTDAGVH